MDVYVGHGVAEDLVVEVTRSEHGLDSSRWRRPPLTKGKGLFWPSAVGSGNVAAPEDHGRIAGHRG